MKPCYKILLILAIPLVILGSSATESQAGFGLGIHYLETLGDIKDADGFDSSAIGFLGAYSFGLGLINFEALVEYVPDYAFEKDMIQPQAYAFIGGFIYGGVGIGIGHINSEWQDSPFFALRAGVKFSVLDVFTSYRFQSWEAVEGMDSGDLDTLTFGAMFKF